MTTTRVYATILVLLACTTVAGAQQQLALVDANGHPVSNAQVFAIAGGNKVVQLTPTGNNGTIDLSALGGWENVTNKPIAVIVYNCDEDPKTRVYYVMPGEAAPEDKEHCRKYEGLIVWTGSGWRIDQQPGPYSLRALTPAAAPPPTTEGPSPFTFTAYFNAGFWRALELTDLCSTAGSSLGTAACSVSNKAVAFGGGVVPYFGFFGLDLGGFRTSNASAAITLGTGSNSFTESEAVRISAFQVGGRLNLLKLGFRDQGIILGAQGGGWAFKAYETVTQPGTSPTGITAITTTRDRGGFSPYYGGFGEIPVWSHAAATFGFQHSILRSGHEHLEMDMWLFGIAFYPSAQKSLIKLGSGSSPSKGW